MAKKKQKNTSRSRTPKSKRHLHAVSSAPKRTTAAFRTEREIDALTPDFIAWFNQHDTDARTGMLYLRMVRHLIDACTEMAPGTSATNFSAWTVEEAVDAVYSTSESDLGSAEEFVEAWHLYLHFLDDTDRWKGSDEEFDDIHGILSDDFPDYDEMRAEDMLAGDEEALPRAEVPDLSEAEQAQGFAGLALIQSTTRLLEWIGAGKNVTQTGVLRLKDVAAAAACVGVSVRPVGTVPTAGEQLPGLEESAADETIHRVRTMHHVPLLSTIWAALRGAGLITVSATVVRTTARTEHWLSGSNAGQAAVYREFITAYLREAVAGDGVSERVQQVVTSMVLTILIAGTTRHAIPRDRLKEMRSEASEDANLLAQMVLTTAQRQLGTFTELGLLQSGAEYVVTPVVAQCVAGLMDESTDLTDAAGIGGDEVDAARPAVTQPSGSRVFQLKVTLFGSEPPIWRRLLVPSAISLHELHTVIQLGFEWESSHLHAFYSSRGRRTASYGPAGLEGTTDEATVALGELVGAPGDSLTYLYDFGDSWEHLIELEDALDEHEGQLPECSDGSGVAPLEDCGGIPGWDNLIAAVDDPSDEMHENSREWLGLAPGESFDAKAFDSQQVNMRLAALR